MKGIAIRAVLVALLSSLFFTFTYVLNRAMVEGGGHWAWMVSMRFMITLPLLAMALPFLGGVASLRDELKQHAGTWLLWSTFGFGLFGICLTWAAASGPAWLIAGSFQITVIAGMLLSPLIYRDERRRIPLPALGVGLVVIAGVLLMQFAHADGALDAKAWLALASVCASAFLYPLGNRMLLLHLERNDSELGPAQRVLGMTLCSQPVWIALAIYAWSQVGWPSAIDLAMAAAVALTSGVIATLLFFAATQWVRRNPTALAAVEAMQAAELLFASLLGAAFLGEVWPQGWGLLGAVLVVVGIIAFSVLSVRSGPAPDVVATDRGA